MKLVNVFLAFLVSALLGLLVLEGGLRLLGRGPQESLVHFDPTTGWSKRANYEIERSTPAYEVTIRTNSRGLHDDAMETTAKPEGVFRVLALGDSFTQGFSVGRDDLFVDRLERWWRAEGRDVEIVNAGTEAWDTAQEVAWFLEHGAAYEPDLVLIFPYQNDLYWNTRTEYLASGGERSKPRFDAEGRLENSPVPEPEESWLQSTAIGRTFFGPEVDSSEHSVEIGGATVPKEFVPLFDREAELQAEIRAHTAGALRALASKCDEFGAEAVVVPLPSASLYAEDPAGSMTGLQLRATSADWSADRPVELLLGIARELGLGALDPRARLAEGGTELYFDPQFDWHLNPEGNAVLASFLHDELEGRVPAAETALAAAPAAPEADEEEGGFPFAGKLYLALWGFLTLLYWGSYPKEPRWRPPLEVGALLAVVFGLVLGLLRVQSMLPPAAAQTLGVLVVVGILGFVAYKMGNRIATILELLWAFTLRGHWYLMPLVVVLLTIGSLLVVAASSPLVAPFIYTLF